MLTMEYLLRTEFSIASLGAYLSSARLRKSYFGAYEQVGGSVLPRPISYVDEDMIKSYQKNLYRPIKPKTGLFNSKN